ncbi:hypothetical protein HY004_01995 [Candidatus Saccharibacteria bacterium]|nr:hypothetical protein [Candidatus Saccharibacteria bacterium]
MYQIYFFGSIILAIIAILLMILLFWRSKKLSDKTKIILAVMLIVISPLAAYMYYGRVSIQDSLMYDTPIPEIERQAPDCPNC